MSQPKSKNDAKRSRSKDFDKSEISLLVDLVLKFQEVLECKKTDAVTSKEKDEVWGVLAIEFNANSGTVPRSASNLKTKFENLKKVLRRKLAYEKCEVLKTGGGGFTPLVLDPVLEKLKGILSVSEDGLHNHGVMTQSF
jgi:Myb/SANT-like DNA-binding domain